MPYRTRVTDTRAVELSPIGDGQVDQVAEFLHRELNPRVAAKAWAKGIGVQWVPDAPNHGFMLVEDGTVVGANIAFYSEREINGLRERFCNLGALCVTDSRRAHAIRLVRAILRQPGYHFTDFSPSGNVIELNRRLGFRSLDNSTALQINWPVVPKPSVGLITDEVEIEHRLSGRDLQIFRDHRGSAAGPPPVGDQWSGAVLRDWSAGPSETTAGVLVHSLCQQCGALQPLHATHRAPFPCAHRCTRDATRAAGHRSSAQRLDTTTARTAEDVQEPIPWARGHRLLVQ